MEFIKRNVKIILLSGKAKSGKDEVSDIIKNYYHDKKCIQLSYSYYLKDYVKRITNWDGCEANKPRELLQQFGISLLKEKIDKHLLINRLLEDIEVFSYFYDIIIITDARLKEEVNIPKMRFDNLTTIRINRVNYNNGLTFEEQNHITETDLDNYDKFDYVVENSTYEKLRKEIIDILKEVKL